LAKIAEKAVWFCKSSAKSQSAFDDGLTGKTSVGLEPTHVLLSVSMIDPLHIRMFHARDPYRQRKLHRYICAYQKSARPFRWTCTDPKHGIRANRITGTAH
jgi:hypothetical protein